MQALDVHTLRRRVALGNDVRVVVRHQRTVRATRDQRPMVEPAVQATPAATAEPAQQTCQDI